MLSNHFQEYITQNQLFTSNQRILLAVSGGVDSVVLCHLMKAKDYSFGVAHCNFTLRGQASDGDAIFVKKLAKQLGVPYFETRFETEKIAITQKKSIQITARELRYEWLENVRAKHQYHFIATAHHLNDSIETALYNLTKGCGIRGLHGILPKNGRIIRPLLFATKMDIEQFATQNQIPFRTDASNATDKYSRNHIRLNIIPLLKKINPSLESTFQNNIQKFQEVETLYDWSIDFWKEKLMSQHDDILKMDTRIFDKVPALPTVLYEILSPMGFHGDQIQQMLTVPKMDSGKRFFSSNYELLIDRTFWWVRRLQEAIKPIEVASFQKKVKLNEHQTLHFQTLRKEDVTFKTDSDFAYFDKKQLHFPLKIRHWQQGDTFQPFGMKGKHKLVSDYFQDKKLSLFEKEAVWILETNGKIAWIVGWRSDERFKVMDKTIEVIIAKIVKNKED